VSAEVDEYQSRLEPARRRFAACDAVTTVLSPALDPETLELFLINYCSLGIGMTEPVEGWIRRAGERCAAIGLPDLGRSLVLHSAHEAGHHLMMIEDTRKLVARWNSRHVRPLDVEQLLRRPPSPGVERYRALHENVIAGDAPFAQLAIELEIENLSVVHGPRLLGRCAERLGPEIMAGLSFLEEHVAVDVGHTKFNMRELDRLLGRHPTFLDALVSAGTAALAAYAEFLDDCLRPTAAASERAS
jgi:hypothetical protein